MSALRYGNTIIVHSENDIELFCLLLHVRIHVFIKFLFFFSTSNSLLYIIVGMRTGLGGYRGRGLAAKHPAGIATRPVDESRRCR